jgi:hypothetical protein
MLNSRVGVRWFPDEDEKLLQEINEKKTFEEIALEHKRTITGIKARVISQIIYSKYKNENKDIDDLSNEFKINNEMINKYINKIERKNKDKDIDKDIDKYDDDILNRIEKKLDKILSYLHLFTFQTPIFI